MSGSLSQSKAIDTLQHLPLGVLLMENGRVTWVNETLQQAVGAQPEHLIGLQQEQAQQTHYANLFQDSDRLKIKGADGQLHWFSRHCHILDDDASTAYYYTEITHMIDQEAQCATLKAQVRDLETKDPVTGLLNRKGILHLLETQVGICRRYEHPLSVLRLTLYASRDMPETQQQQLMSTIGQAVNDQLRWTDQIGFLDRQSLLIILPETRLGDASQLINTLIYERATIQSSADWRVRFDVASWRKGDDVDKLLERLK